MKKRIIKRFKKLKNYLKNEFNRGWKEAEEKHQGNFEKDLEELEPKEVKKQK